MYFLCFILQTLRSWQLRSRHTNACWGSSAVILGRVRCFVFALLCYLQVSGGTWSGGSLQASVVHDSHFVLRSIEVLVAASTVRSKLVKGCTKNTKWLCIGNPFWKYLLIVHINRYPNPLHKAANSKHKICITSIWKDVYPSQVYIIN
jgi:hypothetical protein